MAPDDWDPLVIRDAPKPMYIPPSLGLQTFLLDLDDTLSLFVSRVREYQNAYPKHVTLRIEQYNPYPVLNVIAQHLFEQGEGGADLLSMCKPHLHGLGLNADYANGMLSEVLMMMVVVVSDIFPEMSFADGKHVQCNVIQNGIMITLTNR